MAKIIAFLIALFVFIRYAACPGQIQVPPEQAAEQPAATEESAEVIVPDVPAQTEPDDTPAECFEIAMLDNGNVQIAKYIGTDTQVVIPAVISGRLVTGIGEEAFDSCTSVTGVWIPDSVTYIGRLAFVSCESLITVSIPDSVITIEDMAFYGCTSLTDITIPDSVTYVGLNPFCECSRLRNISLSPDQPCLQSIGGVVFSKPLKTLICYPGGLEAKNYSVPDGVEIIGYAAFYNNTDLTDVILPGTVTGIGDFAFGNCVNLTGITIPDSVQTIGQYAFSSCVSLTGITIPDSVTSIGKDAFINSGNLTVTVALGSYAEQYCRDNSIPYTLN